MEVFITGISGLVGSTVAEHFRSLGHQVTGIDNNSRGDWFGLRGDVGWRLTELEKGGIRVFNEPLESASSVLTPSTEAVIHCAAQPSHDFSRSHIFTDWNTNATGTLYLLDAVEKVCPHAPFIFLSTNKVYGDRVNELIYEHGKTRFWPYGYEEDWISSRWGVSELCPLSHTTHTPFGVSKLAADVMTQEFARTFGLTTLVLRCGCITGKNGSPVELQGFLGHLVRSVVRGDPYTIYGYGGLQVRDNLSAEDLARAMEMWLVSPIRESGVFNMGGGVGNAISVKEAISLVERKTGKEAILREGEERWGDHKWWVSDTRAFQGMYGWGVEDSVEEIIDGMVESELDRRGTA